MTSPSPVTSRGDEREMSLAACFDKQVTSSFSEQTGELQIQVYSEHRLVF